ncbi:phosphonate metabolism protein/1,5-bisphosphokinase (PRPP-forming) PhnN [Sinorhizobium americanum]|nr:phosphonate metabolism protein/1,5-bisphosphokinase (PRPP-forming) PhnN [Sinorhizobium americanum]
MMSPRGALILVVGPSGAGKDTLIEYVRSRLKDDPRVRFVRRVISRPVAVGEDHEPVDYDEFQRRLLAGAYGLHWQAHGLCYGIPSEIDKWLEHGDVVVANGSRVVLSEARRQYPQLLVINVTAPMGVLARRLVERGRENLESIRWRLIRSDQHLVDGADVVHIDNSDSVEVAGERLLATFVAQVGRAKK